LLEKIEIFSTPSNNLSRSRELQEKQAREQDERLKYLKEQAERLRKEMGDATGGATIEAAIAELKRSAGMNMILSLSRVTL